MKLFDFKNDELLFLQQELASNAPIEREHRAAGYGCESVCASGCGANCSDTCGGQGKP